MDCITCGKFLDSFKKAREHYYLGRPCNCYGTPEKNDDPCNEYVDTNEQYHYDYGSISTWKKSEDGNIYPSTFGPEGNLYSSWFNKGFFAAAKLLFNKKFEKSCSNCHLSSQHIINRCEKTIICDKWELDYLQFFDKEFYGHLCDYCIAQCNETIKKEARGNMNLIWECDSFVSKDEDSSR
jgi:hypothetical protein